MLLALTLAIACGQTPQPRLFLQPNLPRARPAPVSFEFAPTNGAGMGTACACTTPTGSRGESLTFARASSATCLTTVGAAPQAIANGDMVTCSTNQPRVMAGADGTSVLGLLVEDARTNSALRSQQIDNAAWTKTQAVVAAPTVTADSAVAPDGTMTADRVQIPATLSAASAYSIILQAASLSPDSVSLFVKGNGTTGTLDLCIYNGSWRCANCVYVSTAWTRCAKENVASGQDIGFGNFSLMTGVDRTAQDVFVWGAQDELSTFATSYIATAAAAVTRATESTPYVTLSSPIVGAASIAASFVASVAGHDGGNNDIGGDGVVGLSPSATPTAPSLAVEYNQAGDMNCYQADAGLLNPGVLGFGATQAFADRAACSTTGPGVNLFFSGRLNSAYTQVVPGFAVAPSSVVTIGGWSTAAPPLNGVVKEVCVSASPSVCALPQTWTTKLAWDGDSEVYGYPAPATSPPVQLTAIIGAQGKTVFDFGHNGDDVAACSAKWTTNIQGRGYPTLIWSCAINDIGPASATGAATAAAVEVTLAAALADGERVIVTGITPWKNSAFWTAGKQTQSDIYNALISAWAVSNGATYVDPSSMGGEGGDPAVLLAAYAYNDHIHYSVAGQLKFAQLVNAVTP